MAHGYGLSHLVATASGGGAAAVCLHARPRALSLGCRIYGHSGAHRFAAPRNDI